MNRFSPHLSGEIPAPAFEFVEDEQRRTWIPVLACPADFPIELFEQAAMQLVEHPEYNSTLILRSETIADVQDASSFPSTIPRLISDSNEVLSPTRFVHRRLLPRRPRRDEPVEQHCTLYAAERSKPSILVLSPVVNPGAELPYYHPAVEHLALRYIPQQAIPLEQDPVTSPVTQTVFGEIEILVVPHEPGSARDPSSRLHRTCRALLETLHRYGWGALTSYQKRVQHDRLVPREIYQDLYLVMRERHKKLVNTWVEGTDPLKHVFEDIGIATFLMLLWKDMFGDKSEATDDAQGDFHTEPWKTWPRPPGGYVDLGCGNGLLVHILTLEGYTGVGIDIRARQSWATYDAKTQSCLRVSAIDPTSSLAKSDEPWWQPGTFLIANHADELTPWAPVLATKRGASGYLSIPCCAWTFDERFQKEGKHTTSGPWAFLFDDLQLTDQAHSDREDEEALFVKNLGLGGDANANASGYSAYRVWLSKLALACGWNVECETLRIPSTRNWAILGRQRTGDNDLTEEKMDRLVRIVQERGLFKTRRPEGKAGDH